MRVQRAKVGGKSLDYFEADHWQLAIGNWNGHGCEISVAECAQSLVGSSQPYDEPTQPVGHTIGGQGCQDRVATTLKC